MTSLQCDVVPWIGMSRMACRPVSSLPLFLPLWILVWLFAVIGGVRAELAVDFNSTTQDGGPHPEIGYESYDAGHEVVADFIADRVYQAFGSTVTLGVDYPETNDNRVQQMIDRGANNDANWVGQKLDLLTDWIGVDTRTGNGGNGDYDGTNGTPTPMTFTFEGIPGGNYHWRSYHHDTENVVGFFRVELSTDGGGSYATIAGPEVGGDFRMTDSTIGGAPEGPQEYNGGGDQDPATLPSTVDFDFTAGAGQDVIIRFIPLSDPEGVHTQLLGVNGFELTQLAIAGAPSDITLSNSVISRTALVGSEVGVLTTTDVTPDDEFTYALVAGTGDDDNSDFDISGDRLIVDRDLSLYTAGTQLSVRIRTTDLAALSHEKVFTITIVNDSDGDGLDDSWELSYFEDLDAASGSGNNDADLLTNAEEEIAGTNPTLADTDDDGLDDHVENGSGVFNGPTDPGSSPILADTDGDGLSDSEEVSAANGHITNPNLEDSDGDGFSDPVELAEETDPNNAADFPDFVLPMVITEIMTRNETGIDDGFETREDWIEIYNPNPQPINLDYYYMTDDSEVLTKWNFPDVTVPSGGYLLVFASGLDTVDPAGHPHSNFKLNSEGEYLALVRPDGVTIDDAFSPVFPEQFADVSYGPQTGDGVFSFFSPPTPGAANGSGYPGVVKDTNFSLKRGFFDEALTVFITTDTPDATIRYTTDGSVPTESHGAVYSEGLSVTTTTTLRAFATKPGWLSTNVDTQTYIYVDDVAEQPTDPAGWPSDWSYSSDAGAIVPSDYEMDPRVVDNALPGYSVTEALVDIPSVSIAMEPLDFLNSNAEADTGIYSNPQERWERPCSIEYILPDGSPGFQYDVKVEVHGNASRRPARMQKHSLRVTFTTEFGGPGRLNYPLFPESPVDEFNKLVLRACFTDSWGLVSWSNARYRPNDSQYFRDVWMKESMGDLGHPTSYGNFVHLYVNGLYFGLHNLTERLEDDFYSEHLGGALEDWEINEDLSSPGSRWNAMMAIDVSTPAGYTQIQDYLDIGNFADYMLLHFYADSEDWPHHNGYAAANPVSGDGLFRFWCWDQEIVLDYHGRADARIDDNRGAGELFQKLRANEEFRLLFADRVRWHCFNGGALSLGESQARYLAIADMIDKAIVAESARWGDTQASTPYGNVVEQPDPISDYDDNHYPPALNYPDQANIYFTREDNWLVERDNVVNNYLPYLYDSANTYALLNLFRSNNLYPLGDAPDFAVYGGVVPYGYELGITAPAGTIYYTIDGSDPREIGGGINPGAGSISTGVITDTLLAFEEFGWSWLDTGTAQSDSDVVVGHQSYDSSDWKHPSFSEADWSIGGQALLGGGTVGSATINTTIDLGADPLHITTYFRKSFSVTDAASYDTLEIGVKRDDGAILYLNGREIGRSNVLAGTVAYADLAVADMSGEDESAINVLSYDLQPGDLSEGGNLLAVEVHQSSTGSSDLGIDVRLQGTRSVVGESSIPLTETGTIRARVLNDGEWSALTEAAFIVGTPADSGTLVVSEMMYNPVGSSEDSEFIELMNIDPVENIDLTGAAFTAGISYNFPAGIILPPLGRIVVVPNQAAFVATYPGSTATVAPGIYTGSLSNGGETITLLAHDSSVIRSFTYDDAFPWPESPDGGGDSLVLIAPATDPDHSLPENWRASTADLGTPGGSDATTFAGDPNADLDYDGRQAFLEYATGTSDSTADRQPLLILSTVSHDDGGGSLDYLSISYQRNLAADDIIYQVQRSIDLAGWSALDTVLVSEIANGDGTSTVTYRSIYPLGDQSREFLRLLVTERGE